MSLSVIFPTLADRSIVSENVVSFLVKNPHSDLSLPRALRTTAGPGQARLRDGHPVLPPDRGRGSVSADAPARGSPGGGGQGLLPQGHHALLSRARGKQSVSRSRGGALRRERVRRRRDLSSRDRRSDAREMLRCACVRLSSEYYVCLTYVRVCLTYVRVSCVIRRVFFSLATLVVVARRSVSAVFRVARFRVFASRVIIRCFSVPSSPR